MLQFPRCRHCQRQWKPRQGTVAAQAYCYRCRGDRREIAKQTFALKPLTADDLTGQYVRVWRKAR